MNTPVCAVIDSQGNVRDLTRRIAPPEQITDTQIASTSFLARLLGRIVSQLLEVRRRFYPRRIDFEDRVVDATGTTLNRFEHRFNARVRWWVVDQSALPALVNNAATDLNTLCLTSTVACTVTVRVEESG